MLIRGDPSQSFGQTTSLLSLGSNNPDLKGIDALTLDYRVEWPLSLVLSRKELGKYQVMMRFIHLFYFCDGYSF